MNPVIPTIPPNDSPNIKPKPTTKNIIDPIAKSIIFFIKTLLQFFCRVKPASKIAKPACISITITAPRNTQTILINCSIFDPPFNFYKSVTEHFLLFHQFEFVLPVLLDKQILYHHPHYQMKVWL